MVQANKPAIKGNGTSFTDSQMWLLSCQCLGPESSKVGEFGMVGLTNRKCLFPVLDSCKEGFSLNKADLPLYSLNSLLPIFSPLLKCEQPLESELRNPTQNLTHPTRPPSQAITQWAGPFFPSTLSYVSNVVPSTIEVAFCLPSDDPHNAFSLNLFRTGAGEKGPLYGSSSENSPAYRTHQGVFMGNTLTLKPNKLVPLNELSHPEL